MSFPSSPTQVYWLSLLSQSSKVSGGTCMTLLPRSTQKPSRVIMAAASYRYPFPAEDWRKKSRELSSASGVSEGEGSKIRQPRTGRAVRTLGKNTSAKSRTFLGKESVSAAGLFSRMHRPAWRAASTSLASRQVRRLRSRVPSGAVMTRASVQKQSRCSKSKSFSSRERASSPWQIWANCRLSPFCPRRMQRPGRCSSSRSSPAERAERGTQKMQAFQLSRVTWKMPEGEPSTM